MPTRPDAPTRSHRHAWLAALALALSCTAAAQAPPAAAPSAAPAKPAPPPAPTPPKPDPKRHPTLIGLGEWLRSDAPVARNCLQTGALVVAASDDFSRNGSEEKTAEEMTRTLTKVYAGKMPPDQVQQVARTAARTAAVLSPLVGDVAGLAFSQLCRTAAQNPGRPPLDESALPPLLQKARACGAKYGKASLDYRECVVRAFGAG